MHTFRFKTGIGKVYLNYLLTSLKPAGPTRSGRAKLIIKTFSLPCRNVDSNKFKDLRSLRSRCSFIYEPDIHLQQDQLSLRSSVICNILGFGQFGKLEVEAQVLDCSGFI